MAIQRILAMTVEEISAGSTPPWGYALMGCHFSGDGRQMVGLPEELPEGCGLILDDRNPIPQTTRKMIDAFAALKPAYLILDFQQQATKNAKAFAMELTSLPCPVAMPAEYARGLNCPVFLPPVPPNIPIVEYLLPWNGHEIWLELALDAVEITLTLQSSGFDAFAHARSYSDSHTDSMLHCHYKISKQPDALQFYCYRSREDVEAMLSSSLPGNLTHAVGLFRELG